MRHALRGHRREGARLHLTFDAAARSEVEQLLRLEEACCPFFEFALTESGAEVTLTIGVPAAAADSADELLAFFTPSASPQPGGCECNGTSANSIDALTVAGHVEPSDPEQGTAAQE